MVTRLRNYFLILLLIFSCFPLSVNAQQQESEFLKGTLLSVEPYAVDSDLLRYEVELASGEIIEVQAVEDHVRVGDRIYVESFGGGELYNFVAVARGNLLIITFLVFAGLILWFTKMKGVRSLLSLVLSLLLLLYVFIPLLLQGYPPLLLAVLLGSGILFLSIFVAHGFTRQSSISFLGSMLSVLIAALLITLIVNSGSFSGIVDHSALYLSGLSDITLSFPQIFSAAVIIGTLGVLDDITITQVAVVRELSQSGLQPSEIYRRAIRVGRDHISSLVNTLVFAYLGSALSLVMFMSQLDVPILVLLSQEFVAAEIVRSLVGAIALVIAVPVTTWCAVYPFYKYIQKDDVALPHCHHDHH
jgi:uncharacterized membrane protein